MNNLNATVEHIAFIDYCVEKFDFQFDTCRIELYSSQEKLHISISGRKNLCKLESLFFRIVSLLFIYLGSSPKLCEIKENNSALETSLFSAKYIPSKTFYKKESFLCSINKKTLNSNILALFTVINETPIHSLQFLLSEAYDKMAMDHKITLLLHVIDGLVSDNNANNIKNYLSTKYPAQYKNKNKADYFCSVYYVCKNYFFNYHRKFNCAILNLLKVNQFQFVQISADTRHWYSHFLAPTKRVNRLKTGEEMLIWFDILQYAIRLMLISELNISVDSNIIQEYYYILHDWILNVKHNKADNVKSNAYKINQSIKAFYANLKSKK